MESRKTEQGYVLRLARGEKVMDTLVSFCAQEGIEAGFLWGLGAIMNTDIGYYNFDKREYFFMNLPEVREVASMNGNVALVDGKPFIHAHAVLSACDSSLACVGAHIKEADVAVTLEVYLVPFAQSMSREFDETTGLKLLKF